MKMKLMIGIVLALLSAATSGLSVVLVRRHSAGSNVFNMSLVITVVGMIILWPLAIASPELGAISLEGFMLFAVSGVFSPGIVRLFYYKGLKTLGASVNSSIFAVYPLYSALLAVFLLSEILSVWNALGIMAILLGVVFVEMSSRNENNGQGKAGWKTLVFPILGGLTLGVSSIVRKYALDLCNTPILGVAIAYAFSLLPYVFILAVSVPTRKDLALKQDFRWFWIAGVGQAVSWTLAFYALSFELVAVTTPLFSVEPLFVALFAFFYLRELEQVSPKLVASIVLTVFGVVLVAL
jgi:drug/metabolite transporter (DMT)-like permease